MKKYLVSFFNVFFKRKEYLSPSQKVGFPQPTLIEIAEKVIEEEERTKDIDSRLQNKLKALELYE